MINRPNNWNEVKEFSDRPKLPLGAYVCRVKQAVVQNNGYGDQLCLLFDIAEGEYKDFYQKDFNANTDMNKKWKGVLRVWLPKNDGSEKDELTKSGLKGMTTAFEKSNPGYTWNWDETSLAGKLIGIVFRNEEWDYNNMTGWAVRPFRAISVDSVRSGEFRLPKDKPLKKDPNSNTNIPAPTYYSNTQFAELDDDDGELPF